MPHVPSWPARTAFALQSTLALLCLVACAPTATVSVPPTATPLPVPTVTPTTVLAPTPTNVPAGWLVLATPHFSLAYPPDWTPETLSADQPVQAYVVWAPARQSSVEVQALPQADVTPYCQLASYGAHQTTLAHLPMTVQLTGEGNSVRVWRFANAQQTLYLLSAGDAAGSSAIQAQDNAVLATFRPDNATPWAC
ncbi:MAG TPA: hypothetical protein VF818_05945 [Ktedonobacterales bacterium]